MIKRFALGAPAPARWPDEPALRAVVCTVIPELSDPGCPGDQITIEWLDRPANFSDSSNFSGSQNFSDSPYIHHPNDSCHPDDFSHSTNTRNLENSSGSPYSGSRCLVVTSEHVLRGAQWLDGRWHDGGDKLKHVALATRAAGLTQAEFSRRWRSHAGTAGTTVIPDEARGLAYVQNHPVPGDWPYDAVNEVYFDDLDGLKARVEWFRANVPEPADGVLFGRSWLIAVREAIVS